MDPAVDMHGLTAGRSAQLCDCTHACTAVMGGGVHETSLLMLKTAPCEVYHELAGNVSSLGCPC